MENTPEVAQKVFELIKEHTTTLGEAADVARRVSDGIFTKLYGRGELIPISQLGNEPLDGPSSCQVT